MEAMKVVLAHVKNPDIRNGSGYWEEPKESGKKRFVTVGSMTDAVKVCMDYISHNGLGGGNWSGGKIFVGGKQVAKVSYNGRLWDMQDKEIPQEGVKTVAQCEADGWR